MARSDWRAIDTEWKIGLPYLLRWAGGIIGVVLLFGCAAWMLGWCSEAANVAKKELGPKAALRKYEWFKSTAAQLDKKRADIKVYQSRMARLQKDYAQLPRHQWPRSDREQHNLWAQEVAGIIASYNGLAADYNTQMAKWNWRFANKGELPKGAADPLPREFKPYLTE